MENSQRGGRILRLADVMELTGLSRSTIYLWVEEGSFPKPIKLGDRAVGWLAREIEVWIISRIEESRMSDPIMD